MTSFASNLCVWLVCIVFVVRHEFSPFLLSGHLPAKIGVNGSQADEDQSTEKNTDIDVKEKKRIKEEEK